MNVGKLDSLVRALINVQYQIDRIKEKLERNVERVDYEKTLETVAYYGKYLSAEQLEHTVELARSYEHEPYSNVMISIYSDTECSGHGEDDCGSDVVKIEIIGDITHKLDEVEELKAKYEAELTRLEEEKIKIEMELKEELMIDKLKAGDKVVVVKDNPNHVNFKDFMEEFLGSTLTVDHVGSIHKYIRVKENPYAWEEVFIDWEATSKLNKPSKLSAKITVVNPLIKIKEVIGEHFFKVEYYSREGFCVSLYDSEVDIIYCEGRLNLDTDVALTRGMLEEILNVMIVIEENLDFFLLKED